MLGGLTNSNLQESHAYLSIALSDVNLNSYVFVESTSYMNCYCKLITVCLQNSYLVISFCDRFKSFLDDNQ